MAKILRIRAMTSVGVFADVRAIAPSPNFQRHSLIYGHNGSGKTTLSRLFSSLAKGAKDERLPSDATFEFELDDGTVLGSEASLSGLESRLAVFNADYVTTNLQWSDRTANPIYYIGTDQAEAAAGIRDLENLLPERRTALQGAENAVAAADRLLATHKRDRAKLVASHLHLGTRKYEANHLAAEYEANLHVGAEELTDEKIKALEGILRLDAPMPKVTMETFPLPLVGETIRQGVKLASQSIGSIMLEEIDRHPEMLQWVRIGHEFHTQHGLDTCLYCAGGISKERSEALSRALDSKVSRFITELERARDDLRNATDSLRTARGETPIAAAIRNTLQSEYQALIDEAKTTFRVLDKLVSTTLDWIDAKLAAPTRSLEINSTQIEADLAEVLAASQRVVDGLRDVVRRHNDAFESFTTEQTNARSQIKAHFLAEGAEEYARVVENKAARAREFGVAKVLHDEAVRQLANLRQQVREHGAAAERVNALIASYLGHSELQVHAVDEGYELWRHGQLMDGHPSEGEKAAIAFCYFLSSLEAEGRDIRRMIIVVDDPISSLDTGALNFCCNLIKSRLSNAEQLFVLTHNHHCMNEFKKAWRKKSTDAPPTAALLFLDVQKPANTPRRASRIITMPGHLRAYDSEYAFLYEKMLRFTEQGDASDYFHLMPNILRRVMEIFLAFKVPGSAPLQDKLKKINEGDFGTDPDRLVALERLSQIESHSDNVDDLISFSSMTIEETKTAASSLLDMFEKVDGFHAERMAQLCRQR